MLKHFGDALMGLFGYFSGSGKFYTEGELTRLAEQSDLRITGVLLVIVPSTIVLLGTYRASRVQRSVPINGEPKSHLLFIFSLFLATIVPASTVIQRIESRWLLAPQILLILVSIKFLSRSRLNSAWRYFAMLILPISFSCLSLFYQSKKEAYTILRDQPSTVLLDLEKIAPATGDWVLQLGQSDVTMPTFWQFGYGFSFSQLSNPPYKIVSSDQAGCHKTPKNIPCISVELNGADMNFKIIPRARN